MMKQSKKDKRASQNKEIIYGVNPIREALTTGRRKIYSVLVKKGALGKALRQLIDKLESKRIPVDYATIDDIAKLANGEGHQGIIAQVSAMKFLGLDDLLGKLEGKDSPVIVALDGVQDPRNLGAILRSAEAFGIDGVIIPERRAAGYTAAAVKASAGAGERLRMCKVTNVAESVRKLRDEGYNCVTFDSKASEEFTSAPEGPLILVMGGEGQGARELVVKRCGASAKIPMQGGVQSLNVSSAASIIFYIVSQR